MIELRLTTTNTVITVQAHAPGQDVRIELQLCLYCGQNIVQYPKKFCSPSHRVIYCQKRIKDLMPAANALPSAFR